MWETSTLHTDRHTVFAFTTPPHHPSGGSDASRTTTDNRTVAEKPCTYTNGDFGADCWDGFLRGRSEGRSTSSRRRCAGCTSWIHPRAGISPGNFAPETKGVAQYLLNPHSRGANRRRVAREMFSLYFSLRLQERFIFFSRSYDRCTMYSVLDCSSIYFEVLHELRAKSALFAGYEIWVRVLASV